MKKSDTVVVVAIPVVSFILGTYLFNFTKLGIYDTIVISTLTTIFFMLIDLGIRMFKVDASVNEYKKEVSKFKKDIENRLSHIEILSELQKMITNCPHPYFIDIGMSRLKNFIKDNRQLFDGLHKTTPQETDAFGIPGLNYTHNNGNLKFFSSINDFWERVRIDNYLEAQINLIKQRNVKIQRIFCIESNEYDRLLGVMQNQSKQGIEVYYIIKDESHGIRADWLDEDYLIQDDLILVELKCKSIKSVNEESEIITTDSNLVQEKLNHFKIILESAKRVNSKSKVIPK